MAPTISVRSAVACISADVSPSGATWPSSAAVRIASVAEVVTLRGRDVPSTA